MESNQLIEATGFAIHGDPVRAFKFVLENNPEGRNSIFLWRRLAAVGYYSGYYTACELAAHCGLIFFPEDSELLDFLKHSRLAFWGDAEKQSLLLPKATGIGPQSEPATTMAAGMELWHEPEYLEIEEIRERLFARYKAGEREAWEKEVRQALIRYPDSYTLWADLATFLSEEGRIDEAMELWPKASEARPNTSLVLSLAKTLVKHGRKTEAISILQDEVQWGWPTVHAFKMLFWLYLSRGRLFAAGRILFSEFRKLFRRALAESFIIQTFDEKVAEIKARQEAKLAG